MSATDADRNLLCGVLALQMDFVSRDQLIEAMNAWLLCKSTPLARILCQRGALNERRASILDALVEEHLACHSNDPRQSLSAVTLAPPLRHHLQGLNDADVQRSLGALGNESAQSRGRPEFAGAVANVSRYQRLGLHAQGGLGQVFVAQDSELKRQVALKEIQDRFADHPDNRARFVREAEVTGNLEHPGVVPVYGLGAYPDGRPFYAMRFIKGESLQDAIQRFHEADAGRRDPGERALSLRGLLSRFVAVCNAVAYAHSRGVLHRDLKPANVMLGEYGETLVVDWGLARRIDQNDPEATTAAVPVPLSAGLGSTATELGQVVGTPAYMPPEQAGGRLDEMGPASDVFSLGAMLYCLLTGRPPYRGNDALIQAAMAEHVPARQRKRSVPAAMEAICARAMAPAPRGRYPSARELAAEVERWLADEPVHAYREPLGMRLRRWGRRHRTMVTAALVLLVACVVGLGLGLWAVRLEQAETQRQRDQARTAEEEAKTQLARAEANLELARQAVDQCFGVAQEHPLLQQEHERAIKKLLLEKTLPFYERFRAQKPDDPALAAQDAEHYFRVAYITSEIGHKKDALNSYEKARDAWQLLSRAHPAIARYRAALAVTLNHLGNAQIETGKLTEGLDSYEQARDLRQALNREHRGSRAYSADLAQSWHNLGTLQSTTGKPKQAQASLEKALELRSRLNKVHPKISRYQAMLADTLMNLGDLHREMGRPEPALANLKQARDIKQALSRAHPEISEHRADLARSLLNLGVLQKETGRPLEALASFEEAETLLRALTQVLPQVAGYRAALALAWYNLGLLQFQAGKYAEAPRNLDRARDALLALTRAHPEVTRYRARLADTWNVLGLLQTATDRPADALASFEQAQALQVALTKAHPEVPRYRGAVAHTLNNLGNLHRLNDRFNESLASFDQALAIHRELMTAYPEATEYQLGLAGTLCNMGGLAIQSDRPDLILFDEAIALLQKVRHREPENVTARHFLSNSFAGRAASLNQLERYEEAVADLDQAERQWPLKPEFRFLRAPTLLFTGEYDRAALDIEQLARLDDPKGDLAYRVASLWALLASVVVQDEDLPLPVREKRAEGYARAALTLLERARRAGYFRAAQAIEKLKKDEALAYLRDRDDFRLFLSAVEQKR
jgi:serine/threonine-protein kinase